MRTGHLPDWTSPGLVISDDPARVLAAVGRLNPIVHKMLKKIIKNDKKYLD